MSCETNFLSAWTSAGTGIEVLLRQVTNQAERLSSEIVALKVANVQKSEEIAELKEADQAKSKKIEWLSERVLELTDADERKAMQIEKLEAEVSASTEDDEASSEASSMHTLSSGANEVSTIVYLTQKAAGISGTIQGESVVLSFADDKERDDLYFDNEWRELNRLTPAQEAEDPYARRILEFKFHQEGSAICFGSGVVRNGVTDWIRKDPTAKQRVYKVIMGDGCLYVSRDFVSIHCMRELKLGDWWCGRCPSQINSGRQGKCCKCNARRREENCFRATQNGRPVAKPKMTKDVLVAAQKTHHQ